MLKNSQNITGFIRAKALEYGFLHCGFSRAEFLQEDAKPLEDWLKNKHHAAMHYMENYFDKRLNPKLLVEGSKSVISLSYNYFPEENLAEEDTFNISKYAYGEDYHDVIKTILRNLVAELQTEIGDFECRIFVDSAPVLERSWARKSGIGWIGKNANLISPKNGSFFFLAEIICDLDLEPDSPIKDYCGTCRKCIDHCPTNAIISDKIIDAGKCISYATIELKNEIPGDFSGKMEDWIFGCDICQDVCPWNRFSTPNSQPLFTPNSALKDLTKKDWTDMTQEIFSEIFKKSPVKRAKFTGLKRNISFVNANLKIP